MPSLSLQTLVGSASRLRPGPVALIFAEDDCALTETIDHHARLGFDPVVVFCAPDLPDAKGAAPHIRVDLDLTRTEALPDTVNRLSRAFPGTWFYFGYNAEFFHYPFCETRSISEMLTFHEEERRAAMLCYVIDLYAEDLAKHPDAVDLAHPKMDRVGYHAQARPDPQKHSHPKERQLDFFGGLRWRFEEHIPKDGRRIDRIALFKASARAALRPDFTFSVEEMNTYACKWHNNLTAAVMSFRTAKALKRNPGSSKEISSFCWHNSTEFTWQSQQLLDLGLIEPGQWF